MQVYVAHAMPVGVVGLLRRVTHTWCCRCAVLHRQASSDGKPVSVASIRGYVLSLSTATTEVFNTTSTWPGLSPCVRAAKLTVVLMQL